MWPEVTAMKFGIEGTGCLQMIKTTIDHVRVKNDDTIKTISMYTRVSIDLFLPYSNSTSRSI